MAELGERPARTQARGQAQGAPDQGGRVAGPGLRRPRGARRPQRARRPAVHRRVDDFAGQLQEVKFIDAVADVMGRRLETDPRDRRPGRGRPPAQRRHERRDPGAEGRRSPTACWARPSARTPSPAWAAGIALDGRFRPVVEFMYADFMWVAADQLFNQIGKARHMFGGDDKVPFVLRSKVAMGTGYGSQHSMDPAGIFATSARLADRRAVDAVRLRRPDEHRARLRRPGRRDRARRPVRLDRPGPCRTTSTTTCPSARRRCAAPGRPSRSSRTWP